MIGIQIILHFIQKSIEVERVVQNYLNVTFEPVLAHDDSFDLPCDSVDHCCDNGFRTMQNYGNFTCDYSREWFRSSRCCTDNSTLNYLPYWPSYIDVAHTLDGKIVQPYLNGILLSTIELIQLMIQYGQNKNNSLFYDSIHTVNPAWSLKGDSYELNSSYVIFASGGFAKHVNVDEMSELGMYSTNEVHADNSGILWNITKQYDWERDPLNAWYLEFVDGESKWFLWDRKSTVLDSNGNVLYDESLSYDERGRIRKAQSNTLAYYLYENSSSSMTFSDTNIPHVSWSQEKTCNTLSKRLWRNFLWHVNWRPYEPPVDIVECASRIFVDSGAVKGNAGTRITMKEIKQGVIDTIGGPKVDINQSIISAERLFAIGNAGSPGLFNAYVAPGSTLGNALVTAYIAVHSIASSPSFNPL